MKKLDIDFDEIVSAFDESSVDNHFYLDLEKGELILINDNIGDDLKEPPKELNEDDRYLCIPEKIPQDDYKTMELFACSLPEKISIRILNILNDKNPFRNFKTAIHKNKKLLDSWYSFKEKRLSEEVVDWLEAEKLEVNNMPKKEFLIKEVDSNAVIEKMGKEWANFLPKLCLKCNSNAPFTTRYFGVKPEIDSIRDERKVKEMMATDFNIQSYSVFNAGRNVYLIVPKCNKCGSEDVIMDF